MPQIPEELKPEVERIIEARVKERDSEIWAKGINSILGKHANSIDELRVEIGKLSIAINHMSETAPERAVATAIKLGTPMLSPERSKLFTEILDKEEEDRLLNKRADKREGLLHNRIVQLGLVIAILYQLVGVGAAIYTAAHGSSRALFP